MRQRLVGRSGLQVSSLTLSTRGWGETLDDEARDLTEAYVAAGGTSFVTAAADGDGAAEETLGRLLGDVVRRSDVVLLARAGGVDEATDASRGLLLRQLDESLSRLRTDYLDLWIVPGWSETVPLAETLSTLEHAVRSGRTRYVGVCGVLGWQLARAYSLLEAARIPLVAAEAEYSLLRRAAETTIAPAADHLGVGLLAGAPLGRGVLTGKYRHTVPADSRGAAAPADLAGYLEDDRRSVVEAVCTAADGLAITPTEVALRWVLARSSVATAVVGARTPAQLRTITAAAEEDLPGQVTAALEDISG